MDRLEAEGRQEPAQGGARRPLGILEDAAVERGLAEQLLGSLTRLALELIVAVGEDAGVPVVDLGLTVVERDVGDLRLGDRDGDPAVLEVDLKNLIELGFLQLLEPKAQHIVDSWSKLAFRKGGKPWTNPYLYNRMIQINSCVKKRSICILPVKNRRSSVDGSSAAGRGSIRSCNDTDKAAEPTDPQS